MKLLLLPFLASGVGSALGHHNHGPKRRQSIPQQPLAGPSSTVNRVLFSTRAYWMRQAILALDAPCPFGAFGSIIVNHTGADGLGDLICTGANSIRQTGNPTHHGEIAAINNCTAMLTDPNGPYKFTGAEVAAAFASLSIYTTAESCPMCASAIRWAGFREYIYGTSIDVLIEKGWGQIRISSLQVFEKSFDLPRPSRLLAGVLANETDPLLSWQFDPEFPCPLGCSRNKGSCAAD